MSDYELPDMGSEDFSEFILEKPGCFFNIGNGRPDREPVEMHNSNFDFNDKLISTGAYLWLKLIENRFDIKLF